MSVFRPQSALLLVAAFGCRVDSDLAYTPDPDDFAIAVQLAEPSVVAGESVGFTLEVTNRGEPVELLDWGVASDLEPELAFGLDTLRPVIAGEHTLLFDVEVNGWEGEVEAPLTVEAASPYDVDLRLADAAALAGDVVSYEVFAIDAFGNELSTERAAVWADAEALVVSESDVSSVVPGMYLVTAELDGVEDVEPFFVDPGPPAGIDLTLSSYTVRLDGTLSTDVRVWDEYGNETWADWTLSTDRPAATNISGANITFREEGWHTVTATLDVSGLSDSEGPLLIDSTGPQISVEWPSHGEWTTAINETVRGAVNDAWSDLSLSINGSPVEVGGDGAYSMPVSLPWGVSTYTIDASDGAGNNSSSTRAVLSGEFLSRGGRVSDGLAARLCEGDGGLGTLELLGEGLIDAQDIDELIPDPVYYNRSRNCWDPCGGWFGGCEVCVTWYELRLRVRNPSVGPSDLLIDPRADGTLRLVATVEDPRLPWTADGAVVGIDYSTSGNMVADRIDVELIARPRVSNQRLYLDLVSVNAELVDFDFQWADWVQDVLGFFGYDADEEIADMIEEAAEDAVADELPPLLEETLNDLELAYSFDIGGSEIGLDATFSSVTTTDDAIRLALGTRLHVQDWVRPVDTFGSLYGSYAPPSPISDPPMQVQVSLDFLNQVAYSAWGAGLLDIREPLGDLGLGAEEMALFFPGTEELNLVVDPLLPPVLVPGTGPETYDLQLGDMQLTLYDGDPAAEQVLIRVYVTAVAGVDLGANGAESLNASVGNADFWFDVTVPEHNTQAAEDTEALIGALVPLLLPRITDVLGEIAVPSLGGFVIEGVQVDTAGEDDAWLQLAGELHPEP